MKVLCTLLIVLLGVASPLSLWADAVLPCSELNQPLSQDTSIDMLAHTDMAAHKDHNSVDETNLHHGSNKNSDSSAIDCDCCVSCISVCASSAGTTCTVGSASMALLLENLSQPNPAASSFHGNPDRNSLFRPPRPSA